MDYEEIVVREYFEEIVQLMNMKAAIKGLELNYKIGPLVP